MHSLARRSIKTAMRIRSAGSREREARGERF
jgi:hypothetical protein